MSVSKTSTVATIAQTSNLPTVNPSEPTSITVTPQKPNDVPVLTLQQVFEKLNSGNQKRELYDEFSTRLANVEKFQQRYEGGSLKMKIFTTEDDEEIMVSNVEIISETLLKTVVKGREYMKKIESELLANF